jgi:hypothetical protein
LIEAPPSERKVAAIRYAGGKPREHDSCPRDAFKGDVELGRNGHGGAGEGCNLPCLIKAGADASLVLLTLCLLERKWFRSCRADTQFEKALMSQDKAFFAQRLGEMLLFERLSPEQG